MLVFFCDISWAACLEGSAQSHTLPVGKEKSWQGEEGWGVRRRRRRVCHQPSASPTAKASMKIQALGWDVEGKDTEDETYFGFFKKTARDWLRAAGAEEDNIFTGNNFP